MIGRGLWLCTRMLSLIVGFTVSLPLILICPELGTYLILLSRSMRMEVDAFCRETGARRAAFLRDTEK